MTEIDLAIIAVLGLSAVFGTVRGFLREALGFATWIVALWMAWRHSDVVAPYLGGTLSVGAAQAEGDYLGTFTVTANYQ